MDLMSICVDIIQSCENKAGLSNLLLVGLRVERRLVRFMGALSFSYELLDSLPKKTFSA